MFSVLEAKAQEPLTTRCESAPLTAAFAVFSETGRMPLDLRRFIAGDGASHAQGQGHRDHRS